MRFFTAFIAALAFPAAALAASAAETVPGPVSVQVLSVYDGDTFTVMAHPWPGHYVKTAIRVAGVDTPEIKGKCAEERELARRAKDLTRAFLNSGPVVVVDVRIDKYGGRALADVISSDGRRLSQALISVGLAVAYYGKTKAGWCSNIK